MDQLFHLTSPETHFFYQVVGAIKLHNFFRSYFHHESNADVDGSLSWNYEETFSKIQNNKFPYKGTI